MSDTVILRGVAVELNSDVGRRFVVDCVRAAEGLISDKELVEIYEISPADWQNIAKDTALARAIRAERDRRVLNGTAAREAASRHFVKAPTILNRIMSDEQLNARHRVDAIKEMRAIASPEKQNSPAQSDRFHIVINLGEERLEFNKSITVNPNEPDEQPKLPEQPKLTLQSNEGQQSDD
jgi:hypothetical protein